MVKMKPCPFCGGQAHLDFAHGSNQTYIDKNGFVTATPVLYMVYCADCFVRTVPCECANTAMQRWNRGAKVDERDV